MGIYALGYLQLALNTEPIAPRDLVKARLPAKQGSTAQIDQALATKLTLLPRFTLHRFETWVGLTDDVGAPSALNHLTVRMPRFRTLE